MNQLNQPLNALSMDENDVALFIDWENIKFSLVNAGFQPNVSSIYETAKSYGRIVIARAYADWQEEWHLDDPARLYDAGIEPVYVPIRGRGDRRKNSVDVKLASDCIEVCHNYRTIKTFVLCSGDADFLHVVNILRPYGKRVVLISVSWTTSMHLVGGVDEMLFYDQDVEPLFAKDNTLPPLQPENGQPHDVTSPIASLNHPELERAARTVLDIVRHSQKDGRALLAYIKHELMKRLNGFDERHYGFPKFKLFMKELERHGLIRVITRDLVDWAFLPEVAEQEGALDDEELGRRMVTFDEATMTAFLRAAHRVQRTHEFTSFNFLIGRIYEMNELPLSRSQLKALGNLAVEASYFERGVHTRIDPATGEISDIRTLILHRDKPEVQQALLYTPEPQAEGESDASDARLRLILDELNRIPNNPTLIQRAAERCTELERYDEALYFQLDLLQIQPKDVRTHCIYAHYLHNLGREEEALAYLQEAIQRFPGHYMPAWTLASIYGMRGEPQKVLHYLRRAQSLVARDRYDLQANLLWHLARTYLELGKSGEAKRFVEHGLRLRPTHGPLQQLQTQL